METTVRAVKDEAFVNGLNILTENSPFGAESRKIHSRSMTCTCTVKHVSMKIKQNMHIHAYSFSTYQQVCMPQNTIKST